MLRNFLGREPNQDAFLRLGIMMMVVKMTTTMVVMMMMMKRAKLGSFHLVGNNGNYSDNDVFSFQEQGT